MFCRSGRAGYSLDVRPHQPPHDPMPLIECPECGQKVASVASVCPRCSFALTQRRLQRVQQGAVIECHNCGRKGSAAVPVCLPARWRSGRRGRLRGERRIGHRDSVPPERRLDCFELRRRFSGRSRIMTLRRQAGQLISQTVATLCLAAIGSLMLSSPPHRGHTSSASAVTTSCWICAASSVEKRTGVSRCSGLFMAEPPYSAAHAELVRHPTAAPAGSTSKMRRAGSGGQRRTGDHVGPVRQIRVQLNFCDVCY